MPETHFCCPKIQKGISTVLAAMVSGDAGHLTITHCSLCTIVCSLWSGLRWADVGIRFPVSALGLAPARAQAPPRAAGRVLAATSAHHSFLVTPSLHFIRFDPDTPLPTGADSYNLKILKLLAMIGCFGSS